VHSLLLALVTFVSPAAGSQAVGPTPIEITTTVTSVDRVEFYIDGKLAGVARKTPYRIEHDFGASLDAHDISAKVYSNGYKNVDGARIATAALSAGETMSVDLVELPVRVRSSSKLKTSDVRVQENGVEQTIRDVHAERAAANFCFVVDRSLSMGDGKLAEALRAINGELHMLREGDTASVILFNQNVSKPARTDSNELHNVAPSGGTSLRDAVASVASPNRTYVIVITDGGDRNSELTEEQALRRISGTKTTVDALVFGESAFLEKAAKTTGGDVRDVARGSIQHELHALLADINSRYTVVYQSNATKPGWRTIEVEPRHRGISIAMARKGYFAQ
jgi:hypothetical protein